VLLEGDDIVEALLYRNGKRGKREKRGRKPNDRGGYGDILRLPRWMCLQLK
jgi:hypothetical protein